MNDLMRLFSIGGQLTLPFLVVGLAILSIGAWWSVKSSVEASIRSRLESEANRLETTLRDRLDIYANTLVHLRGRFTVDGIPQKADFRSYMSSLELARRFPGIRGIGYIELRAAKASSVNAGLGYTSQVELLEPDDWQNQQAFAFDALSEPKRRSSMLEAALSTDATLTEPVNLVASTPESTGSAGFLIYLPIFESAARPTKEQPLKSVKGFVYAAFHAAEFFEGALGRPSLNREHINFSVEIDSESGSTSTSTSLSPSLPRSLESETLYNRFDITQAQLQNSLITVDRHFEAFGRKLRLKVVPLNHFFSWSDRYLPMAVGFGAGFISILILLVLNASRGQLLVEKRAKELSFLAMQRSKTQTELLKKLNDFARAVSLELDLDILVGRFFELVSQMAKSQVSFLYFASVGTSDPSFSLHNSLGLNPALLNRKNLSLSEVISLVPDSLVLRKSMRGAADSLERLIEDHSAFSDWLLAGVPSHEFGRCGVLFLARTDGSLFEEMEIELIESLVSQVASAIENAQLFRRVEDASRAKNAFLANMSHEIRTPLNVIIGFSEMLVREGVSGTQREGLARSIRKGSERLTRIIDDILDISKVETGKLHIEKRRVHFPTLIDEIRNAMDPRAAEKCISLTVESSGLLPVHLLTDDVRIKQILSNIIDNAIKFTERGAIMLHIRQVQADSSSHYLAFRIKDTGPGISEDAQRRLFEPFSQGDESKTRKFGGSGLGLALSRRLCQELGGELYLIESIKGQGSTFEARIALDDFLETTWTEDLLNTNVVSADGASKRSMTRLNNATILIVEDSVDNQEIFRFFLENAGAKIEIVDNGIDAVSRAAAIDPDLILMDIQIPEIDGKEATRRIRDHGYDRPIVALTAHAMFEERESCLEAGCDGQITKPVSGENLVLEVARYLRRKHGRLSQHFDRDETALFGTPQS
jgi:CheY-like chemotaxis protein/CHASE1-domain containing sensor protein/nitrogen-specific signal transduction histidine kinase